jgi:hypothetical protein
MAFFNRFGNPKQNNIISIAHSIFPYFLFQDVCFFLFVIYVFKTKEK